MDIKAFGVKPVFKVDPKTKKPVLDAKGKKVVVGEEYFINPLIEYVKPYTLIPRNADLNPAQPEQIIVPANGQSADVTLEMVDEGLFEGAYLTAGYKNDADPKMLMELIDNQRRVSLTGRPCHVDTVIGNGARPFVLPESLPVDKRQPIVVRFYDLSGAENDVRFQIHGQRIYSEQVRDPKLDRYVKRRQERNRHMSMYLCPTDIDPVIPANATRDYYFTNDYNIYFEVRKITYKTTGKFKFQIIDEKNNGMQSGWIESTGAIGTAQYPFIYYGPWMIVPGGKVTFRIQDLSGDENPMYITLSGRQHFVYPGP
jgi:hypothetical protein